MATEERTKLLAKSGLSLYLFVLLWLVLFKFSYDVLSVITTLHMRSLNLIPFVGNGLSETLENIVVFIPLGLLLGINFKRVALWRMLLSIFAFSFAIELTQFVLAIGRTDITDVITNTVGGLLGLLLYVFGKKHIENEKLDQFIIVVTVVLLLVVVLLRTLVFKVKY